MGNSWRGAGGSGWEHDVLAVDPYMLVLAWRVEDGYEDGKGWFGRVRVSGNYLIHGLGL